MLRDAEYFKTRIGSLDGANDAGDYIIKIVHDKNVPRSSSTTPPPDIAQVTAQVTPPPEGIQPPTQNANGNS